MKNAIAVARKVHAIIRRELPEHLVEIDRSNLETEHACATQDHCDANVYMDEAFVFVMEREMDSGSVRDAGLWNSAWDMAIGHGFNKEW